MGIEHIMTQSKIQDHGACRVSGSIEIYIVFFFSYIGGILRKLFKRNTSLGPDMH